jgi:hypothetical protein
VILLAFVAGVVGCTGDTSGPGQAPVESGFYPLQIGNGWSYAYTSELRFFNADSGALLDEDGRVGTGDVTLDRTEQVGGTAYVVERTVAVEPGAAADTTWVRLRQDDTGLFRADLSNRVPPDSANAATAPAELTRLRYPLAPGAQWVLLPGPPLVTATVESFDTLQTPGGTFTAYRVRIVRSDQGSNDSHLVWYGRCGMTRIARHSELVAVDAGTGDRIRIVTDETQLVVDARLTERIDCAGGE